MSLAKRPEGKGQFVEAIRAYENALKLNPRRSLRHFRLAEVFFEQFNLQAAANSFRDALNGDKDPEVGGGLVLHLPGQDLRHPHASDSEPWRSTTRP